MPPAGYAYALVSNPRRTLVARPLVEQPDVCHGLLDSTTDRIELTGPPSAGGANELLWYIAQFQRLANCQDFDPDYSIRNLQQHMLVTVGRQALTNVPTPSPTCCSAIEP